MQLPIALRTRFQAAFRESFGFDLEPEEAEYEAGLLLEIIGRIALLRASDIHRSSIDEAANKRDARGTPDPRLCQ